MFLARQDLLSGASYQSARVIREAPWTDSGYFEDVAFRQSIYQSARTGSWSAAGVTNFVALVRRKTDRSDHPFFGMFSANEGYDDAMLVPAVTPGAYGVGGPDFMDRMELEDLGASVETNKLALVARKCLRGKYRGETATAARAGIQALIADLNDDSILADRASLFWLLPIALNEAKRLRASRSMATLD